MKNAEHSGKPAVRLIHFIPGRVRLCVASARQNPKAARAVEEKLAAVRGVRCAEANSMTGSIVVHFDAAAMGSLDFLMSIANALGLAPGEIDIDELHACMEAARNDSSPSPLSEDFKSFWRRMNEGIRGLTAGEADLKLVVPLALCVMGIGSLMAVENKRAFPSWYEFIWFAFGTYMALNTGSSNTHSNNNPHTS